MGMFPCSIPKGDIKTLMKIEERWFRRVTEDFLVMRRMILAYRSLKDPSTITQQIKGFV
jgi:hypothetical protein